MDDPGVAARSWAVGFAYGNRHGLLPGERSLSDVLAVADVLARFVLSSELPGDAAAPGGGPGRSRRRSIDRESSVPDEGEQGLAAEGRVPSRSVDDAVDQVLPRQSGTNRTMQNIRHLRDSIVCVATPMVADGGSPDNGDPPEVPINLVIWRAGGPSAVARVIRRDHSTVVGWTRVPAEHVRDVARLAGLHPHELRPDLYDPPAAAPERAA